MSYETHWPLLLLTDERSPEAAESAYLYQGNIHAVAAIRHLADDARRLERNIRQALGLRDVAPFSLSLPDGRFTPITSMMVIKSLVKQLVEGQKNPHPPRRASLLGLGHATVRVNHSPDDYLGPDWAGDNFVARVCIHPPPRRASSAGPRTVDLVVSQDVPATKIVNMLSIFEDTTPATIEDTRYEGEAFVLDDISHSRGGIPELGTGRGTIRLFHRDQEIEYWTGVKLSKDMFTHQVETRRKIVDLVARWE